MGLCSLSRTNPSDRHQQTRVNGPLKLGMVAEADNKLSYGSVPGLILVWMCSEANGGRRGSTPGNLLLTPI